MAKYTLTNKAVEDLSEIWNYTYEAWSEKQADKYYELIIAACQEIAENPTSGKNYDEISKEILGFGVGKHIIFYRTPVLKDIEVIRILHGRMDLRNRLDK
ncbi:type II toxin-antitoxin system RelE/ParE family toxin [Pontibacter russatus]|uniref:type II toxin-antitoxin system RelE/ParE family toxin n=1 Tax=Pontibacter russatus TaxID=2694929 RepID=UPI001379647E|nr:type II toxin-antitoxin system RelE/ParE family toxin [Pontibacter russatus]